MIMKLPMLWLLVNCPVAIGPISTNFLFFCQDCNLQCQCVCVSYVPGYHAITITITDLLTHHKIMTIHMHTMPICVRESAHIQN